MSWGEDEGIDFYDGPTHPSINFTDGKWTDAKHNTHQIKDMEIRHIQNCIDVLKHTTKKWDYPNGDKAEIRHKINEFEAELKRRQSFEGKSF